MAVGILVDCDSVNQALTCRFACGRARAANKTASRITASLKHQEKQ